MKIKTTQKAIKANFKKIVCVGYCNLQHLLNYESPIYYTIRRVEYDILRKYDNTAQKIVENRDIKHDEKVKKVNKLLKKFLKEEI